MGIIPILTGLVKPAIDAFFRWKEGEDKIEISRQEFELKRRQLEADIALKLEEAINKPDSDLREFMLKYEGAAKDLPPWMAGLRASVRPFVTYWAIAIITALMFGGVDADQFSQRMNAIPERMWWIFLVVFGFWFGGRSFMHYVDTKNRGEKEKQAVMNQGQVEQQRLQLEIEKARVLQAQHQAAATPIAVAQPAQPAASSRPPQTGDTKKYVSPLDQWQEWM